MGSSLPRHVDTMPFSAYHTSPLPQLVVSFSRSIRSFAESGLAASKLACHSSQHTLCYTSTLIRMSSRNIICLQDSKLIQISFKLSSFASCPTSSCSRKFFTHNATLFLVLLLNALLGMRKVDATLNGQTVCAVSSRDHLLRSSPRQLPYLSKTVDRRVQGARTGQIARVRAPNTDEQVVYMIN